MERNDVQMTLNDLRGKGSRFTSHDFIRRYAFNAEREYIRMLWEHRDSDHPFQAVHSQIGRELEQQQREFGFEMDGNVSSENIFGNPVVVPMWRFRE